MKKMIKRYIAYPLEAIIAFIVFFAFRIMPLDMASAVGSFIGKTVGSKMKVTKTARNNIKKAFPEKNEEEIEKIIEGMWDNLGRNLGEFSHIQDLIPGKNVEYIGNDILLEIKESKKPALFVSAHLGNWEVATIASKEAGLNTHTFYRAPNNPYVHWIYKNRPNVAGELLPKGSKGAKRAITLLKKGDKVGFVADQKMNDGIPVEFFGREAMTAPALANFALKFKCPIIMHRVERLGGANFRLTVYPPVEYEETGDRNKDVPTIMRKINSIFEEWITEHPEQWFWVHNRWPKE